jgi:hypothetical protein
MEGPGLALRPHGLGQHPRRTRRERTRACGRPRRSGIVEVRGRNLGLPPVSRTAWPAGRYGSTVRRCPGRPALPGCTHDVAPELCPGPRGAASLWACSQQARHPRPSPPRPWRAGSVGPALNVEPVNARAAPQNYPPSGGRLWSLIGPARPAPASRARRRRDAARRRPRPTRHLPPASPVVRWRRQGRGRRRRCLLSSKPGQHSHRRPASGTHRPRRIRAWPSRGGVTAPGYGRSGRLAGLSASQRDQDPLEDAPGGMRGCSPGWAGRPCAARATWRGHSTAVG